jgi:RNA polymerase sigma-70 factor (ECF subfamily)
LAEIFGRHREMVYRVCLRWLGHHHDAEDVTQETFRRAAIAIHTWDNRRPIEPWLVTIAGNRCRSFLSCRRREKLTESIDHFRDEYSAMALEDRSVNEQQTIAEDCLLHAMEGLPRNHRRAFELVHREELSYPQAAQQMGRSVGTIKTWVHRARTAMRKTLQRDSLRRTVAASVASLLLICGWFVSRPIESRFSGENLRSSGENATAIVSPRHAQEIMGNLRLGAGVPMRT